LIVSTAVLSWPSVAPPPGPVRLRSTVRGPCGVPLLTIGTPTTALATLGQGSQAGWRSCSPDPAGRPVARREVDRDGSGQVSRAAHWDVGWTHVFRRAEARRAELDHSAGTWRRGGPCRGSSPRGCRGRSSPCSSSIPSQECLPGFLIGRRTLAGRAALRSGTADRVGERGGRAAIR
jgi:hypothetical protein